MEMEGERSSSTFSAMGTGKPCETIHTHICICIYIYTNIFTVFTLTRGG